MNNNPIKELSHDSKFGGNDTLELSFEKNIYIVEKNMYDYTIKKNEEVVFDQKFNIETNKDIININFLDKDFKNAIIAYYDNIINTKRYITGSDFIFRDLSSIFKKEMTNIDSKYYLKNTFTKKKR